MPRREILTPTERMQLLAFPDDEGESITGQKLKTAILSCVRRAAFSFVDLATHVALSDAGKR